jgi:hypothetical protein
MSETTMSLQEANETIAFASRLEQAREVAFVHENGVAARAREDRRIAMAKADLARAKEWHGTLVRALAVVEARLSALGDRPGPEASLADESNWAIRHAELVDLQTTLTTGGSHSGLRVLGSPVELALQELGVALPAGNALRTPLRAVQKRLAELEGQLEDRLAALEPPAAATTGKAKKG